MRTTNPIVLFDGQCGLCNRSVKWIIDHDPDGRFRFAAQQSAVGQRLLAAHGLAEVGMNSMILIEDSAASVYSTAVLRIARGLPFPWNASAVFLLIPRPIRDVCYRWIAQRRHDISGKLPACSVPTPKQRERILGDN